MRIIVKKITSIIVCLSLTILLIGCGDKTPKITYDLLNNLEFNDKIVDYDGNTHSIEIDNPYNDKGVIISYNNNQAILPGEYLVEAIINYEEITIEKTAKLTIEKITSNLVCTNNQEFYTGGEIILDYQLNNTEQEIVILNEKKETIEIDDCKEAGTYNLEIYAKETTLYKESNHINVTLNVIQSFYDLKFESKKEIADGSVKTIEVSGNFSKDYTIKYENNTGIEKGEYFSKAFVLDYYGNVVETYCAVLTIDNEDNVSFSKYLDEFLVKYIGDDQFLINSYFENPENFGISKGSCKWYTYHEISDEEQESLKKTYNEELKALRTFKNEKLSESQMIAYRNIESLLKYYVELYSIKDFDLMELTYVNSSGGYVAEFDTYIELYSLRKEEDIQDMIEYIKSTKDAFISYLDYVEDRENAGFELSKTTIDNMRSYLIGVLSKPDDYYLTKTLSKKIEALDFLTSEEEKEYKRQLVEAMKDYYMVGVKTLYEGFDKYFFYFNYDVRYLAEYEKGKELYILELERTLGYDNLNMADYISALDKAVFENVGKVLNIQEEIIEYENIRTIGQFETLLRNNSIYKGISHNIMDYLKTFSSTISKELQSEPNVVIKEMDDAAAKESGSLAFYLKSALDNTGSEYITINSLLLEKSTNNDFLATLAHEGYPGHLYAYNYLKELDLSNYMTLVTNTAFAEGWATYIELKLYEYAKAQVDNRTFDMIMDYLYAEQLNRYLIETRIDVGIHYERWEPEDLAEYLYEAGYDYSNAVGIYYAMVEMPAQYSNYGYGKLLFYNLHEEAKKVLGEYYNEIEFNEMILSKGWVDLEVLEEMCHDYLKIKCYELDIDYK